MSDNAQSCITNQQSGGRRRSFAGPYYSRGHIQAIVDSRKSNCPVPSMVRGRTVSGQATARNTTHSNQPRLLFLTICLLYGRMEYGKEDNVREDESIAVDPFGVLWVESHELVEQDVGHRGHAHGSTRVARVGLSRSIDLKNERESAIDAIERLVGGGVEGKRSMAGHCDRLRGNLRTGG